MRVNNIIVASKDSKVIDVVEQSTRASNYKVVAKYSRLQALWSMLSKEAACLILDIELFSYDENEVFTNIVKSVRPRLPIIILLPEQLAQVNHSVFQSGIYYRAVKPASVQEIEQVIDSVDRMLARRCDDLVASI